LSLKILFLPSLLFLVLIFSTCEGGGAVDTNFVLFPDAPININVHDVSTNSASLSWMPAFDRDGVVTNYTVFLSTNSGSGYYTYAKTGKTNIVVTNLIKNTTYYFVVRSVDNSLLESPNSSEIFTKTSNRIPTTPSGFLVSAVGANVISLSWGASTDPDGIVTHYKVYGKRNINPDFALITNTSSTSVLIDNLTNNQTFQYYVVAVDDSKGLSTPTSTNLALTWENIRNADFDLNNTGTTIPNYWTTTAAHGDYRFWLTSYAGHSGVMRFYKTTGGSGGNNVTQDYTYPVIVNPAMTFTIRFWIVSSGLSGDGAVIVSHESPVQFFLNFVKPGSPTIYVERHFNITHDGNSAANPDFELVSAGQWVEKSYTLSTFGVTTGYRLSLIKVNSYGHARDAYVEQVQLQ